MNKVILVRYGEIHLKGLNRPYFERLLMGSMKAALKPFPGAVVTRGDGRYFVHGVAEEEYSSAISALSKVFGIHSISPADELEKDMDQIFASAKEHVLAYLAKYGYQHATFKVATKRSDKRFPMSSMEISAKTGEWLLEHVEGLSVDVKKPQFVVSVEIRDHAYVYVDTIAGQGGMPLGSNGKAMLLLSGGIDSPVAGYMIAKRGVYIDAVHFESFPYTSERAREKVLHLAQILAGYGARIRVHVVHFTNIQLSIYEKCPEEMLTVIMRRYMMRIAERIAKESGAQALITGESIGQVASQTMEALNCTNSVVSMPVFRPLIGMDKNEITERSQAINAYETSILPFEDCCTVFVPKHPSTRPKLERIEESETVLDSEALIQEAIDKTLVFDVTASGFYEITPTKQKEN